MPEKDVRMLGANLPPFNADGAVSPTYEDPPLYTPPSPRVSRRNKILDAIRKPFDSSHHHHSSSSSSIPTPEISTSTTAPHKGKECKERSPALQDAIIRMEARKALTIAKMEQEGKDTSILSGRRADQVRNPLRG
ncbi:unnamed protein product [Periconia digitata]|uniref:Uncharacterized protein n=1 Tax=Periconia digitata TaxID=1303443 RepID=A0A9W4XSJ8_9PLEO|nr:unnamed protein product [Periconia digitata]